MKIVIGICAVFLIVGIASAPYALSAPIVLDFEGIGDLNPVGDFYNGGAGTNYGVQFSANALASVDFDAGGSGNFGGEPSPDTTMFFLEGQSALMSIALGFDTGFSFYYAGLDGVFVSVFDGINGTGNMLATLSFPATENEGAGADPNGFFGPFVPIGVQFEGIAKSVAFGGPFNQVGFDNITFGSATPGGGSATTPLPAPVLLLGTGLIGIVSFRRKFVK
jgi:hypothetical protein